MVNPEYFISLLSIVALLGLAYGLHRRNLRSARERDMDAWTDLNSMMKDVYAQNDSLKSDLHQAGKHVTLLQAVNQNLKNTVEDMSHAKSELLDELKKLERSMDALHAELEYVKNPPPPQPEPTSDDLDEWYESQNKSDAPNNGMKGESDIFKAIRDAFTFIPPGYDAKKDSGEMG